MEHLDRIKARWAAGRQEGLFFWQVVLARALYHVVFLPLAFVLAPFLRSAKVRVMQIGLPQHIGHLTLEPDCYVKEGLAGLRPGARRTFLICRRDRVVNPAVLDYWRRYFTVVTSPIAHDALLALKPHRGVGVDVSGYFEPIGGSATYPEIYRRYGRRPPLLTLTEADQVRGRAALARLGMPADAWWVCVHCREGGYYGDDAHSYRDARITSFDEAMATITAAGGWCVRMGDPSMTHMAPAPNVVDYAHHAERSPWLDVYLVARSRFFLGTSSGLLGVAVAFGVPAGLTNQAPMSVVLPVGFDDVAIPKLTWDEELQRELTFAEVLGSPAGNFRYKRLFDAAGLRPLENDPQDITDLVHEMLQRTAGGFEVTAEDEALLQAFKDLMVPGHYSYGAASRIGRDFLRRHRALLVDAPVAHAPSHPGSV